MAGIIFGAATPAAGGESVPPYKLVQVSEDMVIMPDADGSVVLYAVEETNADTVLTLSDTFTYGARIGFINGVPGFGLRLVGSNGQVFMYDGNWSVAFIDTVSDGAIVWLTFQGAYGWQVEAAKGIWRFLSGTGINGRMSGQPEFNTRIITEPLVGMSNPGTGTVEIFNFPPPSWQTDSNANRLVKIDFELYIQNTGGQGSYVISSSGFVPPMGSTIGMTEFINGADTLVVREFPVDASPSLSRDATNFEADLLWRGSINLVKGSGANGNIIFNLDVDNMNYAQQIIIKPGSFIRWSFVQ